MKIIFGIATGINIGLMIGSITWNGGRYSMVFVYSQLAIAFLKMMVDEKAKHENS